MVMRTRRAKKKIRGDRYIESSIVDTGLFHRLWDGAVVGRRTAPKPKPAKRRTATKKKVEKSQEKPKPVNPYRKMDLDYD
jgi:hypothetical protein